MYICIYIYLYLYIYINVFIYVYIYIYICIYIISIYIYVYLHMYILYLSIYLSIYKYLSYMYIYYMYLSIYIYVYLCVCIFVVESGIFDIGTEVGFAHQLLTRTDVMRYPIFLLSDPATAYWSQWSQFLSLCSNKGFGLVVWQAIRLIRTSGSMDCIFKLMTSSTVWTWGSSMAIRAYANG